MPPRRPMKKPGDAKVVKKPLTRHGFQMLAKEHDELMLVERPKVVLGIQIAAAEGDRSENAEYIYGRKRLRELDKRLRYLGGLLKDVALVDPAQLSGDKVSFGATVVVCDEDGKDHTWTIVGEGETEFYPGGVCYKAPVALALIGRRVGDVVIARRPAGDLELEITDLFFAGRNWQQPPVNS